MSEESLRIGGGERAPARETERLTPEQYETLAPLLKLADLGNANKLAERLKPGEIKRAELKRRALEGLREHGTITHAAAAAGVTVQTIYNWRTADPEFADAVTEFMHVDQVAELHESMYRIATSTDPKTANAAVQAGKFLLQSLDRRTYGDHLTTESTLTVNQMVQVSHEVRDTIRQQQAQALQTLNARTIDAPPLSQSDTPALPSTKETP